MAGGVSRTRRLWDSNVDLSVVSNLCFPQPSARCLSSVSGHSLACARQPAALGSRVLRLCLSSLAPIGGTLCSQQQGCTCMRVSVSQSAAESRAWGELKLMSQPTCCIWLHTPAPLLEGF